MQGDGVIRQREALVQPVVQHRFGTAAPLFGRLGDEDQGAFPLRLQLRQAAGGPYPYGHVHVVAAGVHHAHGIAVFIACGDGAGVGLPGFFNYGQRIHVGAHQQGGPRAVFQQSNDAIAAYVFSYFETSLPQFGGHAAGGLGLVKGQLGMGVQMLVQALQIGVISSVGRTGRRYFALQSAAAFAGFLLEGPDGVLLRGQAGGKPQAHYHQKGRFHLFFRLK